MVSFLTALWFCWLKATSCLLVSHCHNPNADMEWIFDAQRQQRTSHTKTLVSKKASLCKACLSYSPFPPALCCYRFISQLWKSSVIVECTKHEDNTLQRNVRTCHSPVRNKYIFNKPVLTFACWVWHVQRPIWNIKPQITSALHCYFPDKLSWNTQYQQTKHKHGGLVQCPWCNRGTATSAFL